MLVNVFGTPSGLTSHMWLK